MYKLALILSMVVAFAACTRGVPVTPPNQQPLVPTQPTTPAFTPGDYIVSTYHHFTGLNDLATGLTAAPGGNLYISGIHGEIWKLGPDSTLTTFTTLPGRTADIVSDANGNLFVLMQDAGAIIRITPAGNATTFATGLTFPQALDIDGSGDLFVADGNKIRKVDPAGRLTTLYADTGRNTSFSAITVDKAHNVYFAKAVQLFRLDTLGNISFVAGGNTGDKDGTGSAAWMFGISGLRMNAGGNLVVADEYKIREITPAGVVTSIAGLPQTGSTDGDSNQASFEFAVDICVDAGGVLYVNDDLNQRIRKIKHK